MYIIFLFRGKNIFGCSNENYVGVFQIRITQNNANNKIICVYQTKYLEH